MAALKRIAEQHSALIRASHAAPPSSERFASPSERYDYQASEELSLDDPETDRLARKAFTTFWDICRPWAPCIDGTLDTYDNLRLRSPVLLFCILAVTSRFDPDTNFSQYCERQALSHMRSTLYSSHQQPSLDDLKGTIIFNGWMSKGTPPGHSIALALQLELPKALETVLSLLNDPAMEEKVDLAEFESRLPAIRTWFSLYAQDMWLSVATGRRPMVTLDYSIHNSRSLLKIPALRDVDARMVAQCELVTILGGVQDRFLKTHKHSKAETAEIIQLANTQMDLWMIAWIDWARSQESADWFVSSLQMQNQAARFYANTLGLRDITSREDISVDQMPVLKASLAAAIELQYVAATYGAQRMSFATEFTHISVSSAALFLLKMIKLLPSALPDVQITLAAVRTAANLMAGAPVKLYFMAVSGALEHLETHLLSPQASGALHDDQDVAGTSELNAVNSFLDFDVDIATTVQKCVTGDDFWSWAQSLPAESFAGILS